MTDTIQNHALDADRANLVRSLAELQAQAAELTSHIDEVKAELRNLPPGDFDIDGRPALRIMPTRRFDVTKAAGLLSAEQRKGALVVAYDAAEVKRHLTQVEIDECMVDAGKAKVVIL